MINTEVPSRGEARPHDAPRARRPGPPASRTTSRDWRSGYVRRIAVGDAACAAAAALAGYMLRFGHGVSGVRAADLWLAALLPLVWTGVMFLARSYEQRFLWTGPEEFRRIFFASAQLLATVGTTSWALRLEVARGFVLVALPLTIVLTVAQRFAQRKWVHARRRRGHLLQEVLLVGHPLSVLALREQLAGEPYQGYRVIGCCLPRGVADHAVMEGLPVLGTFDEVVDVVVALGIDTVAVLPSAELEGAALRRLGWELETTHAELLLAPGVTEIVGPRLHIRPVGVLPLVHVERPELRGVRRMVKGMVDRTAAVALLVVLLPVLAAIAMAIRATTPGPVLFRQERVGRDGRPFEMLKFRTMEVGAEARLSEPGITNEGNDVLFKLRTDPRVTRLGRILRRYSADELPQLVNVLRGEMSLVGPRPSLGVEVERYGIDVHRRFRVKPGLTGLWQVSGRSNLSWADSVRMDLRYVENWSLTLDLMILWKTIGAVVRGRGAY